MYKTDSLLIKKCRTLRRKGFTLGEILKAVHHSKTTVYDHIRDISLPNEIKKRKTEISSFQNPALRFEPYA